MRGWCLQQLRSLGLPVDAAELDEVALLERCKSPDFSFFTSGAGQARDGVALAPTLVWAWRDACQNLSRVQEQLARLPVQLARALAYWKGSVVFIGEVIDLKKTRIGLLQTQLQLPSPPAEAFELLMQMEALRGEVHELMSSLLVAEAMVQRGDNAHRAFGSSGVGSRSGAPGSSGFPGGPTAASGLGLSSSQLGEDAGPEGMEWDGARPGARDAYDADLEESMRVPRRDDDEMIDAYAYGDQDGDAVDRLTSLDPLPDLDSEVDVYGL